MTRIMLGCLAAALLWPLRGAAQPAIDPRILQYPCDSYEFIDLVNPYPVQNPEREREISSEPGEFRRLFPFGLIAGHELHRGEMHDCQRLALDGSLGPRAAVMISARGARLSFSPPPGESVGAIVAEIVNYDREGYAPLHIAGGPSMNCLWLQAVGRPDEPRLTAVVFQPAAGTCVGATPSSRDIDSQALEVRRHTGVGVEDPENFYPVSGRWMWDHRARRQFIGSRCGEAWCEIGAPGFTSETRLTADPRSVPGWGDEQILSQMDGDRLVLSTLYGRITPEVGVERLSDDTDFDNAGAIVARVTLTDLGRVAEPGAARAAYQRKLGFSEAAPRRTEHAIVLRLESGLWYLTGDDAAARAAAQGRLAPPPQSRWANVIRGDHQHSGRRTARWAWSEKDEGVWSSCKAGCCMSDENGV